MGRTNANTVYRMKMTDGSTHFEKGRASFGGFIKAMERVEARTGKTYDSDATVAMTEDEGWDEVA